MRKFIAALSFCFILTQSFGQAKHSSSLYLQGQYNRTIFDATAGNNPWGMGLGLQLFLRNAAPFTPTIELTADAYLEDDKVLRTYTDETPIGELDGMINLFAGASCQLSPGAYLSFVAGPSFLGGKTRFGIKPALGLYFSQNQKWMGKLSYITIFNREERTKQDFGSVSLALGMRLY